MAEMTAREAIVELSYAQAEHMNHGQCRSQQELACYIARQDAYDIAIAALEAQIPKPNLPLTEAQIMALPDDDAIYTIGFAKGIYVWDSKETKLYMQKFLNRPINRLFFAAKPTPADIEAARKGKLVSDISCKQ